MTAREQRLALGFATLLIGGVAWIGFEQLMAWKKRLDAGARSLEVVKAEAEELLAQQSLWDERTGWLAKQQPAFTTRADSENSLLGIVNESVSRNGLTILKTQPTEPIERPGMVAATIVMDVRAELEKVMRWLYELQQPSAFLSIPAMRLIPDPEDSSKVILSLSVQRWFKKTS